MRCRTTKTTSALGSPGRARSPRAALAGSALALLPLTLPLAGLVGCGGPDAGAPTTVAPGEGSGGDAAEAEPPASPRALGPDATFADLAAAARTLDERRDQDSDAGCLLRPGWELAADLAVAVRPLPEPPPDLDARLGETPGPVVLLSRWGIYGTVEEGRLALSAVTTTMPPRVEPAVLWAVTDEGVWVRRSDAPGSAGPTTAAEAARTLPEAPGALFLTAEAGVPLDRLAEVLRVVPARLTGQVGLAVALAPNTRLPEASAAEASADVEGRCPDGLPPLAEGARQGQLRPDRIVQSLGPLRQGAEICVGATDGPGAAGGRVVLGLRIGPDGTLEEACVLQEEAADPTLRACLLRAARATSFPLPDPPGSVDVQLPLVLAPLDSQRQRPLCE